MSISFLLVRYLHYPLFYFLSQFLRSDEHQLVASSVWWSSYLKQISCLHKDLYMRFLIRVYHERLKSKVDQGKVRYVLMMITLYRAKGPFANCSSNKCFVSYQLTTKNMIQLGTLIWMNLVAYFTIKLRNFAAS